MSGKKQKKEISITRSSAAEYLTFVAAGGEGGVEAVYADENVWLSQKMMATLYDVNVRTVNEHLKKIFADSELQEAAVIRKFRITARDGKTYNTLHYNLKASNRSEFGLEQLEWMVSASPEFAENMAIRHIPLTMDDGETRLNSLIQLFDYGLLNDVGRVTAEIPKPATENGGEEKP